MFYDKKIKYLDYLESGVRIKGGGFVKREIRDRSLQLEINVMGLQELGSLTGTVMLLADGREEAIGEVAIAEGKGLYRRAWQDMADTYKKLEGIRVFLGGDREVICRFAERGKAEEVREVPPPAPDKPSKVQPEPPASDKPSKVQPEPPASVQPVKVQLETPAPAKSSKVQPETPPALEQAELPNPPARQPVKQPAKQAEKRRSESARQPEPVRRPESSRQSEQARQPEAPKPVKLMENKWEQLCAIYPHVFPFRDDREYLSIRPADFVLFPSASYKLVNNSFLLHGFYNYNHLILGRLERKGELRYYIGVPGSFFEREKQVAIMFGFESFECAEEPAQTGDFGYYMMRTEL